MCRLVIALACIVYLAAMPLPLQAQVVPSYRIDTATTFSPGCDTLPVYAYFQVKGKYPESAQTLVRWGDSSLHHVDSSANGYVTFRVLIDCTGKLAGVKLLQTNEHYESVFFKQEIVEDLYAFVKSLHGWKAAIVKSGRVNYTAYLSFKIQNGHVVQVVP